MSHKKVKTSVFDSQFFPDPTKSNISMSKNEILKLFHAYSRVGLDDMKYFKPCTVYKLLKSDKSIKRMFKPNDCTICDFIATYADSLQLDIIGFVTGGYKRILENNDSDEFRYWYRMFKKSFWDLHPQYIEIKMTIETKEVFRYFNKYMSKFEYFRQLSLILFYDSKIMKVKFFNT